MESGAFKQQGAQGRLGGRKSEARSPKAEGNPRSEGRIQSRLCAVTTLRFKPSSDFGFRASFGLRSSAFGSTGCSPHSPVNQPDSCAAPFSQPGGVTFLTRSEERRVGKESR